ncbi:MAG TPA: hypothetical protein VK459_16480 [Polyangiaceae bacterium]|nr:hypothetical protein [Polyangiaceae bacterium]
MNENIWVELSSDIVIARVRGVPTAPVLRECQERILTLLKDTGCRKVLYDALELEPPQVEDLLVQQKLSDEVRALGLRVAILVPNTRLAYMSRLAFGQTDHRVFYNDLAAAIRWLTEG